MKSIVQPIAVWGRKAPSHSICALMLTDDQRTIVTGSREGQICLWNLSPDFKTLPRIFLFGHTSSITSLGKASEKQPYVVSAAENGEMCLWNVTSGQCIEHTKLPFTHTAIYYYYRSFRMSGDGWLLCCGQYQDVLVVDARSLELLHALVSSATPDWISSMCIVRSQRIQEDSLVGISVTGDLKVWDLSSSVNSVQERENVYEAESKSLQCFNCQAVCFCTYTERLLLVVCSDCWKVFDYCDFSLLCFANSKNGHHWAGGEVLAANKIIIWTEDGHSYIYQLPDRWSQMGKPREKFSSLFKTGIFTPRGHSLSETVSPRLLCYTSNDVNSKFLQAILIFINERKEPFHKILFCGEASGKISMWHIPDVPMAKRDGSPQEIQVTATLSLQGAFEQHKTMTEEITDQLGVLPNGIQTGLITASVYIPDLDKLVCGCENGRIIITLGLHAARAQLLVEHSLLKGALDRHETGDVAKAIIGSCDDSSSTSMNAMDSVSMGARPLDPIKKKNTSYKQSGSFKFSTSPPAFQTTDGSKSSEKFAFPEHIPQPFTVLPVKTKWSDSTIHVLLFDVSTIFEQLLSYQEKEPKLQNSVQSHETLKRLTNIDGKKPPMSLKRNKTTTPLCQANGSVKDLVREHLFYNENNASGLAREGAGISKQKMKPKGTKKVTTSAVKKMDVNMATDAAKLLISCLFPWGVDRDLDELCIKHLGMFEPRCPVSFGLLSKDDYLSLLLPGWYQVNREVTKDYVFCSKISNKVVELAKQVANITQACIVSVEETLNDEADGNFQSEMTSYLLSVILLVNIQMRMPFLSKGNEMHNTIRQQKADCLRGKGGDASQPSIPIFSGEVLQNRTFSLSWGLSKEKNFDTLTNLIASWQAQSVELLEAIQAMLLAEVQRVLRALRKKPISNQPVIRTQNGKSEPQTVPQIERIELQESQQLTSRVMPTSVKAVTHDSSPDLTKHQEAEDVPDGCAFEESDSPDSLREWRMSRICFCKVC
ncbi:WD repeat-containing protein 72-like isoform X5 [Heptranchias perlo]|uniref:WD repeat-containing protein 72-like isoform X5 n=1 Tax=Heptranchias perlo TaxID=212740 RepID=UPI00355A447E